MYIHAVISQRLHVFLLLSHSLIFFRFIFYQYMIVFRFNYVIYVFLLLESMYYYCCLCILIVRPCILNVVYVFLLWFMYSYCSSMYSYCCLCILIVVYVFSDAATLTGVFPCFFLGCKTNARLILAKTGHGPHSSKIVVLFYVLFIFYCFIYCLCVNVYCTTATG